MPTALTRPILGVALATALLLLVPLVAMQWTDEVNWSLVDFGVAGSLLFGAGVALVVIFSRAASSVYRAAAAVAIAGVLLLIWTNLAVGLIGSEDNPANLLYGGVLVAGVIGCLVSRLTASGLARTLFVMAGVQAAVPMIALVAGNFPPMPTGALIAFLGGSSFFVAVFAVSGLLFRRASLSDAGPRHSAARAG